MGNSDGIEKLIKTCQNDGTGLLVFAGAGVSVEAPTCFPASANLAAVIIKALCSTHPLVEKRSKQYCKLTDSIRLEVMLDILLDHVGPEIMNCLRGFCRDATPNLTHKSIVSLIKKAGNNSLIATTNFDCMFEKALDQANVQFKQMIALPTVGFDSTFSSKVSVIKLHGSVFGQSGEDTFHTIQAAISQVGKPVQLKFRQRFLKLLQDHNILVVGYSGLDDFDLRDLWIEAGKKARGKLVWIQHKHEGGNGNPPKVEKPMILDAWKEKATVVECNTSKTLCKCAGINCPPGDSYDSLDWFYDFAFDPRIRNLAIHGLTRLLIHASTIKKTPEDRKEITEHVDWLLGRGRELETVQSTHRRYWSLKDQASGLPKTERSFHLLQANGLLADLALSVHGREVLPCYELAVAKRELAWGIKDLNAPGESWEDRPEECEQIHRLCKESFNLAKAEWQKHRSSPLLLEHYIHSARDHAWGLLFIKKKSKARNLLTKIICDIKKYLPKPDDDRSTLAEFWFFDRVLVEIAHSEQDLARFMTMADKWDEASKQYKEAANHYKQIGKLAEHWICMGGSAAAARKENEFNDACKELETLQANQARDRLIDRRFKWENYRKQKSNPTKK